MKDTPVKTNRTPFGPPKSKFGLKKEKMASKKGKEHKTPIMKVGKGKKQSNLNKKSKLNKDNPESIKRKRGRPKNEVKLQSKKPVKEQKSAKKFEDTKTNARKRKSNTESKFNKEHVSPPLKKTKFSDNNYNLNGDIKMPFDSNHKSYIHKDESDVDHSTTNIINSNGTLHCKKTVMFSNKKSPLNTFKNSTFHLPTSKKELLNGNNSFSSFKFQPPKHKNSLKKIETNSISKDSEVISKNEKFNNLSLPPKEQKEILNNDFEKCTMKDISKCCSKETIRSQSKESLKAAAKETVKQLGKDCGKSQMKEPIKVHSKEPSKLPLKDSIKSQQKEQSKSQMKEEPKSNSKEALKFVMKETNKSQVNESAKSQIKETNKLQPKDMIKPIFREPVKSHPQRMASLDAMAKMHVICTTDRKPPEHKHTSVAISTARPLSHQKSITHERIQFDVKKETNEFKGNIVHKQEINFVKEKQQVFVSHSVEQSSIVEHEQSKTVSTKVQDEKEKKKKTKPLEKSVANSKKLMKNKVNKIVSNRLKMIEHTPKLEKGKSKSSKNKDGDKKIDKNQNKSNSKVVKTVKEKPDIKSKKTKKVEQTKSEVKVKETIRMQKTCTYQSVTTVNSHGTANSSVVPVSHVGMTTNYSKTKKTVLTDEECKNKNFSTGSVVNNSYCLTTERPCSVGPHTDCCKFHAHPQIIPVAHVQTCSLGHSLNRTPDTPSSSSSHCDGTFSVYRFGHQQPVIFTPSECGCCCASSLVSNVHDSCLLRKSIVAYPHHLPSHHNHLSPTAFSPDIGNMCTDCHPSGTATDSQRHHRCAIQHSPTPHSRVTCCACCESNHHQHHHQSSLHYNTSQSKTSSSIVPCEQSPLDLSLTSSSSNISMESDTISLPQGHSPLCCRDLFVLRTSPHGGFTQQISKFPPSSKSSACCKCGIKQVTCETHVVDAAVQSLSCSNKNSLVRIGQPPQATVDRVVTLLATSPVVSQVSLPPVVASTSGVTNKSNSVPRIVTDDTNVLTAKREKSTSPKQSSKPSISSKKRIFAHGWSWKGKPREKLIALTNDSVPCPRVCYPSVQHKEGDTISERDCVLLRSGPKDTDLPYVAKVAAFWENPEDGEMMMSLLWYYRPEHTDQGRKPGQMEDEVFASRHKDVNSVACIEDKCYVLTYNEYCRYKANLCMDDDMISLSSMVVPELPLGYPRKNRLPCEPVSQDIIFFCRHVYDFRQKRILKNPT